MSDSHKIAENLAEQYKERNMNEADTRHHIIDIILHDILCWPKSPQAIKCEKNIKEGYIDYLLHDQNDNVVLLIEAKKEGSYFSLPAIPSGSITRWVRLKTLMTDPKIKKAIEQAFMYCAPNGFEFAAVTNGHEWILFKTLTPNQRYTDLQAFVITSLDYFSYEYTDSINLLGYTSITINRSLKAHFSPSNFVKREAFHPKNDITYYDEPKRKNDYAQYLEPLAYRFLRDIPKEDNDFMKGCYVTFRGLNQMQDDINNAINDVITPFFQDVGIRETSDTPLGGSIGKRISDHILAKKGKSLLTLFAGAGSGKTTFLERLFYYSPPALISTHTNPVVLDLRYSSQDPKILEKEIWEKLKINLDSNKILDGTTQDLIDLYQDRYEIALRQELHGFRKDSELFIKRSSELLSRWKDDLPYTVRKLRDRCLLIGRVPIIVIDNTDQLSGTLQDFCFLTAQNISDQLDCLVIISMREERFYRAQASGVMDAYHNNGFHLATPDPTLVFIRRVNYMLKKLSNQNFCASVWPELDVPNSKLSKFLEFCLNEFQKDESPLKDFLANCSQGNIRDALSFFRGFITSGYTDVNSIIDTPSWTLQRHQVIKPMMIPERHNYNEDISRIPNMYQLRSIDGSSHFTGLRILRYLSGYTSDKGSKQFVPVREIINLFDTKYDMKMDCEENLDIFIKHSILIVNNRLDRYQVEALTLNSISERVTDTIYADQVKITSYGQYIYNYLCSCFAYLDLVSLDTAIRKESLYHAFVNSANKEYTFAINNQIQDRLILRLARVEDYINYLQEEEDLERENYQLSIDECRFASEIRKKYEEEKRIIRRSAAKR